MKYTARFVLVILLSSTLLLDCNCSRVCNSPMPGLKFVNFDSATLNVVILKLYNDNGQFNSLQHTYVYTSNRSALSYPTSSDTIGFDTSGIVITYSTDYSIEIPAAGRTWYLRNVGMQVVKMNTECTNGLKYYLNDTLHTIPPIPAMVIGISPIFIKR